MGYTEYANVCLCWDGDYSTINSVQDLYDFSNNNAVTIFWDIFDASSGMWLDNRCYVYY